MCTALGDYHDLWALPHNSELSTYSDILNPNARPVLCKSLPLSFLCTLNSPGFGPHSFCPSLPCLCQSNILILSALTSLDLVQPQEGNTILPSLCQTEHQAVPIDTFNTVRHSGECAWFFINLEIIIPMCSIFIDMILQPWSHPVEN